MSSYKTGQIKVVDVYRLPELEYGFGFDVSVAADGHTPVLCNVHRMECPGQNSQAYHRYGRDRIRNGDVLMEVSGVRVNSLSLDQIKKLLRCSGSRILLKIQRVEDEDAERSNSLGDYDSLTNAGIDNGFENGFVAADPLPAEDAPTDLISAAQRLAKRLFFLDGFKAGDVPRELCKRNRFTSIVVEHFMAYFDFYSVPLDRALRTYLLQFTLPGAIEELDGGKLETNAADRERVLQFFCGRYIHCNPEAFSGSVDACYILVWSLLLLNTDLHRLRQEGIRHKKMTFSEFRKNLKSTEHGDKFESGTLKSLYHSIKHEPLVTIEPTTDTAVTSSRMESWHANGEEDHKTSCVSLRINRKQRAGLVARPVSSAILPVRAGGDGRLASSNSDVNGALIRCGWLDRKCVIEEGGKRINALKRQWVHLFARLVDLNLCLYRTDSTADESPADCVQIHHSLASALGLHKKRQNVFILRLATNCLVANSQQQLCLCRQQGAEYLFQAGSEAEMKRWVDDINLAAALYSSPPLAPPVGSKQRRNQDNHESWLQEGVVFPVTKSSDAPIHQRQWYWAQLVALKAKLTDIDPRNKEVESMVSYEIRRNSVYVDRLDDYLRSFSPECAESQGSLLRLSGLCTLREDCSLPRSSKEDLAAKQAPPPSSLLKRDAVVVASSI